MAFSSHQSSKMKIFLLIKILFSSSLFVIFVSFEKYQTKEIFIIKKKISVDETGSPAITICASNPGTSQGWKNETNKEEPEDSGFFGKLFSKSVFSNSHTEILKKCKNSTSVQDVFDCVNNKTYSFEESVSFLTTLEFVPDSWISDMSLVSTGKCYTLNNNSSLGSHKWSFSLKKTLSYRVYIHDLDFFLMTSNPETIPNQYLHLQSSKGLQLLYIKVVKHIKMDRPGQPCHTQPGFSFTACVKTSVARNIGCR